MGVIFSLRRESQRCGVVRGLLRQPLFALTAILTIGIGIGINSTIFSLINSVIFKPLPIGELDRFVNLYTTRPDGTGANAFSLPDFRDLEESQSVFDGALGYGAFLGALAGPPSEVVFGEMVSAGYFSLLGLEPVAGRLLDSRDARAGSLPTAVISDRLWQTRFAGRSNVIGSSVLLNGRSFALVGIAAPPFSGLLARGVSIDVWVRFSQLSFLRQPGRPDPTATAGSSSAFTGRGSSRVGPGLLVLLFSWPFPAGVLFGRSTTTVWLPAGGREIQNGRVGLDFFQTPSGPIR